MAKVKLRSRPRIEIEDTHPPEKYAKAHAIAMQVAEKLHDEYPYHPWRVLVSSDNSTLTVCNDLVSEYYGYHLHVRNLTSASEVDERVRWAAGELLERFRISRERVTEEHYLDQRPAWVRGRGYESDIAS